MYDMIEQVAKAIGNDLYGYVDEKDTPNTWRMSKELAKTAIEAMRVPTDNMIIAMEKVETQLECFLEKEKSPSYLVWQAAIEEALK